MMYLDINKLQDAYYKLDKPTLYDRVLRMHHVPYNVHVTLFIG